MSKKLTLLLYNLLLPLGLVLMLPGALRKMRRRGGRWQDLGQRIGLLPPDKLAAVARLTRREKPLWMHAVSVGEVGIATKLIQRLLKERPETGIVLTTTTPTGHALAEEFAARHAERMVVLYSPIDLRPVAHRFLALLRPAQIVLVEAEVWPNLVSIAKRWQIPVSLVNARLSARSERRFRKFGALIRPVFGMLDQVMVQEKEDGARFVALGVREERIFHTGSIKFDPQGPAVEEGQLDQLRTVLRAAGIAEGQPILLLASTHAGEEALLARVYLELRRTFPDLALLIVPRHVERAEQVAQDLLTLGLTARRRSRVDGASACLIIDTTGELRAWQCLATVVVIGKSFLSVGGQNPAEAVMAKKPVLFGPHMENFEALVDLLLAKGGAVQVADPAALTAALAGLLADPTARARLGESGHAVLQVHEGATQKTVARLFPEVC
ncbi:MAG TPA: glycosyltransferase N-terminal domain-containing protein [Prosthecobacter sp.]|nr:glycosyltransferase N-terminal domain-containing protein [Prosthecobacter sp.]